MNQLLIALLISTSLAGVIQGGFVSSTINDQNQVIDQQPSAEVSKAMKDDLSDFNYINMPVMETSSTIVQNNLENEPVSCTEVISNLKEAKMISQPSSNLDDKADNTEQADKNVVTEVKQTSVSEVTSQNTKIAEKAKDNKIYADKGETTTLNPVKKEEKMKEEKAVNTENEQETINVEANKEMNTATENPDQEENTITVTATAYTANCEGGTGVTYTGIDLKANPDSKVIAVDPAVIPLGTEVYVEGYGYAIAADIGGAIKGNKIDVFIPSESEAEDWGIKTVEVKIL